MTDMTKQDAAIWFFRVLTPISVIGALGVQWGIQTTDINNLKDEVGKIDHRVTALESIASTSQTNAYRLSRLDASVDDISKKSATDHDTLVRIDQTVQSILATLSEVKNDIKSLSP